MRLLDEQYTKRPHHGVPKLTEWLRRRGYVVNRKQVARLMRKMGLSAIYPKPKTSAMGKPSKVYPYLLKGLSITRPNQVWATDITYIRLNDGFVYLVAIMDWFSRYVLSWELSNSLDVFFCLSALERALSQASPLIFNNDQGSQFTSGAFTGRLEASNIAIRRKNCPWKRLPTSQGVLLAPSKLTSFKRIAPCITNSSPISNSRSSLPPPTSTEF